jgi:hypothetical protein
MPTENTTLASNATRLQLLKGGGSKRNISEAVQKPLSAGQGIFNCYPNVDTLTGDNVGTKIVLEARTIISQSQTARGPGESVTTGANIAIFRFIAPSEITETVSHTWESYESLASKIAEKWAAAAKGLEQAVGVVEGLKNQLNAAAAANSKDKLLSWAQAAQQGNVEQQRVDMPLVYKDSEKRRYELTFQLACYKDSLKEIVAPVKALETLSCASLPNGPSITGITPPCIFTITTEPQSGLIYVKNAALLTVQPTYRGPFNNGLPSSCELHLTLQEIDPLWDTVFVSEGKSKVLVSETSEHKAYASKLGE